MFLNIAAYQFAHLNNREALQSELLTFATERSLKGTILLAPEGINLFVAGEELSVRELLTLIKKLPGLGDLTAKESWSATQPFTRMLVRLKKETIAFGVEKANPLHTQAGRISAKELKAWYDSDKDFILLDTRNEFEIEVGAFKNTQHLNMHTFKDFIQGIEEKLPEWRTKPIVTVCTGGIRCEKAAPFMNMLGFENVQQLDGGILKYFEECGSEHYQGDCFVFDKRVALNAELEPTGHGLCWDCQAVLEHPRAKCPRCPAKSYA
ncbi:MAG: rhodanese-like domain-containing protein [Myxococcota bacterium]